MKLIDILNARHALEKILPNMKDHEVISKTLFVINETSEFELLYKAIESALIRECAELDSKGNPVIENSNGHFFYKLKEDKKDIFEKEIYRNLSEDLPYHIDEDMYYSDDELKDLCDEDDLRALELLRRA